MTKLYEVTFFKKWSQEVLTIKNIFADSEYDAIGLLIDLDNNEDIPDGLDDLEYTIREIK